MIVHCQCTVAASYEEKRNRFSQKEGACALHLMKVGRLLEHNLENTFISLDLLPIVCTYRIITAQFLEQSNISHVTVQQDH